MPNNETCVKERYIVKTGNKDDNSIKLRQWGPTPFIDGCGGGDRS